MSTINTSAYTSLNPVETASGSSTNALGQEDFLKLMTEQLKAQDPMNPGDTGEFLGQMAQFASVSGIQSLQQTMSELATSLQSTQALQASGMVGRTALIPADTTQMSAAGGIEGTADLPYGTGAATWKVLDARGETVHSGNLDAIGGETVNFAWDGLTDSGEPAPAGTYRVEVTAITGSGPVAASTQLAGRVESVLLGSSSSGGLTLNIEGLGKVPATQVTELR